MEASYPFKQQVQYDTWDFLYFANTEVNLA
jgi:hypothetical protein